MPDKQPLRCPHVRGARGLYGARTATDLFAAREKDWPRTDSVTIEKGGSAKPHASALFTGEDE